jgi:hypothetical protein
LLTPDSGAAVIAGHDVLREPDKVRAKIGLAGQSVTMDKYRERPGEPDDDRPLYRFSRRDAGLRSQELIAHFDLAPRGRPARLDLLRRDAPTPGLGREPDGGTAGAFRYVFGGAVDTGDVSYASFLIPGVMAANAAPGRHGRGGRRRNRHLQRDRGPVPFAVDVPLRSSAAPPAPDPISSPAWSR